MGFGLFVPEFRTAFGLSSATVGVVSSLGFLGMFAGLVIAQILLVRRGPGAPVLLGLLFATVGMALVAAAPNLPILALGVFFAASSAGFAWTPFNDAVHRKIPDRDRPTALSDISTGTSVGIVIAGLAAFLLVMTDLSWRSCWLAFAVAAACALFGNRMALRDVEKAQRTGSQTHPSAILRADAVPLFAIAFVFGIVSANYISFAAGHVLDSGGVPGLPAAATPPLLFVFYGLFGLAGLLAGLAKDRIGLPWLLRLLMLAGALSAIVIAKAPAQWAGLLTSAALQGLYVMMTSAVLAFWSERLFLAFPAMGFTAALLSAAAGSVLGPVLAGFVVESFGSGAMFLGTAALPVLTAVMLRDRHVRERGSRHAARTGLKGGE